MADSNPRPRPLPHSLPSLRAAAARVQPEPDASLSPEEPLYRARLPAWPHYQHSDDYSDLSDAALMVDYAAGHNSFSRTHHNKSADPLDLSATSSRPTMQIDPSLAAGATSPYPDSAATSSTGPFSSSSPPLAADPHRTPQPSPLTLKPSASSARSRRSRKEKPYIALAPDQPPTTQGKQRTRVFVACLQCRSRKIRCDGAKPICHNCTTRPTAGTAGQCDYDATPKRRGPDKVQGARMRSTRPKDEQGEAPKRRRRRPPPASEEQDNTSITPQPDSFPIRHDGPSLLPSDANPLPFPLIRSQPPQQLQQQQQQQQRTYVPDVQPRNINLLTLADVSQSLLDHPPTHTRFPSDASSYTHELDGASSQGHPLHDQQLPNHFDFSSFLLPTTAPTSAFITPEEEEEDGQAHSYSAQQQQQQRLDAEPSLQFARKLWWDHLLALYSSFMPSYPFYSSQTMQLTQGQRDASARHIMTDLSFLFRKSNYWFSFFNVPRFYTNFLDPVKRSMMQPSLVLAVLAAAVFLQSAESGRGEAGRRMAMALRDEAQSALDASLSARWIDESLAQAAWILAFFEVSAHPLHTSDRVASSMRVLDSLVRSLALTYLDVDDPQTSKYPQGQLPIIPRQAAPYSPTSFYDNSDPSTTIPMSGSGAYTSFNPAPSLPMTATNIGSSTTSHRHPVDVSTIPSTFNSAGCTCDSLSLGRSWPEAKEQTPLWVQSPAWNYEWSEAEVRKEECRRLSWSCIMLTTGYSSYTAASGGRGVDMFLNNPANYAILFPGEALTSSPFHVSNTSGKETVWALYLRAELLWNSCLRLRYDTSAPDAEKADRAMKVWLETEQIDSALNRHTCGVERACLFIGREYLFNTRMCISYEFQRFIPHVIISVARTQSEEWLREQEKRAKMMARAISAISNMKNHALTERPFFVWWFMSQFSRALKLWTLDHSLTIALDVCKAFLEPIDFLTKLWPCPAQRRTRDVLVERLEMAYLTVANANASNAAPSVCNASLSPPGGVQVGY